MHILFLDDSATRNSWHVGYGGYCIDGHHLKELANDIESIKRKFGIPSIVELKWSPGPDHFLRTKFKGVRHDLYKEIINNLFKYNVRIICAVHALKECYGVKIHGWDRHKATRWAVGQQLRFVTERFNRPYLSNISRKGIIVCDEYNNRSEEEDVASQFILDMTFGTNYTTMENIGHVPFMTLSKNSVHVQVSDVLIGVVTSAMSGGRYGLSLFDDVARQFLWNPHEYALSFECLPSSAIIGYGLKVFPAALWGRAHEIFKSINEKYRIDNNGWKENV